MLCSLDVVVSLGARAVTVNRVYADERVGVPLLRPGCGAMSLGVQYPDGDFIT